MTKRACVMTIVLAACGHAAPPPPSAPALDPAPAVTALREGRFEAAAHEADAILARDPHNSGAAAARAIATYVAAGDALVGELGQVIDRGETLKYFDHERGRAAWRAFEAKLDAADRDLAVVAADPGFALELCLACWEHDWNHNGRIDDRDRRLFELDDDGSGADFAAGDPRRRPTFRFDVGDALWARAMLAFQRAVVELVLAYRWSELDHVLVSGSDRIAIHLVSAAGVDRARRFVMQGLDLADRCRAAYLAETDDDREWVPNPRQHSHPIPLAVDDPLYATWAGVTGDVRRLMTSEEGISMRELGPLLAPELGRMAPDAYLDLGAMFRAPTDIVLAKESGEGSPEMYERVLRGLLGHGYATRMKPSPLLGRLRRMKSELDRGEDTLERKLRYLLWFN